MRSTEPACPFCASALTEAPPERPATGRALTRAAILFAGATAISGCSSEPVAMYGPAPVDASSDAADAATDGNTLPDVVAMYGPAPVDAGQDATTDATTDATPTDASNSG